MDSKIHTVSASPNIAFIKYWGKRDHKLTLPFNSSVSMTLENPMLKTITSVKLSEKMKEDEIYINGNKIDSKDQRFNYMLGVIEQMRSKAKSDSKALVVSKNMFPTGSGLASSASGAAALSYALNSAFGLDMEPRELSKIARQVSGSGSRSIFGGFVVWHKGSIADGSDSYSEQIAPKSHWDELIDIICMVDSSRKKVSSTEGHELTARTSALFKSRIDFAENGAISSIQAIKSKDFQSLAQNIMRDSNNMHAVMLDSWPPIIYLNSSSLQSISAISELNESEGKYVAAYTFDAGPNPHIITTKANEHKVIEALDSVEGIKDKITGVVGDGPSMLDESESLIKD